MPGTIGWAELGRMLRGAAASVRKDHEELSRLDSFGGDGDHGTTMQRAMGAVEKALDGAAPRAPGPLLQDIGWAVMGIDGGATGPLFGSFFMGMAEAMGDRGSLDAAALAAALDSGLATVQKRTKAHPGDKTMIDALVPAVEAARGAAAGGAEIGDVLRLAAEAAARGAESTASMVARFGRAKTLGAKSAGSRDPGATSVSLIFRGFFEGYQSNG
jgi:phosphoenolpyruvate---glycerone phosphotransferase subunit DhaL